VGDGCHRCHGRSRRCAEPAGPPKPRRAHNPGGQRQSVEYAQQRQRSSARAKRHGKAIGRAIPRICCPEVTAARRSLTQPRAGWPSNRTNMGTPPMSGRSFYPPASASPPARSRPRRLRLFRSPIGESAARAAAVSLPGAGGSSRLSSVCVSVVMLAVAALGVVRLGGRRLPACRCSRGRRPTGCDSEATGPLAALLQRHPSADGGRLTRTRLRPACRLQRPCSLPRCSCQPSIVGVRHTRQRPAADSSPERCVTVLAAGPGDGCSDAALEPGGVLRSPETGARSKSLEDRCWRRFLAVESRGTVADQAVRVERFSLPT
jgi:hypothetical protein